MNQIDVLILDNGLKHQLQPFAVISRQPECRNLSNAPQSKTLSKKLPESFKWIEYVAIQIMVGTQKFQLFIQDQRLKLGQNGPKKNIPEDL